MNSSTKKWLFIKFSSAILIPLMLWFLVNLVSVYDSNYPEVVSFFATQPSKILFSIFLRLQQVAKVSLNGVVIDTASSVREVYTLGRSGIFRLSNTFVTSGLRLN